MVALDALPSVSLLRGPSNVPTEPSIGLSLPLHHLFYTELKQALCCCNVTEIRQLGCLGPQSYHCKNLWSDCIQQLGKGGLFVQFECWRKQSSSWLRTRSVCAEHPCVSWGAFPSAISNLWQFNVDTGAYFHHWVEQRGRFWDLPISHGLWSP